MSDVSFDLVSMMSFSTGQIYLKISFRISCGKAFYYSLSGTHRMMFLIAFKGFLRFEIIFGSDYYSAGRFM